MEIEDQKPKDTLLDREIKQETEDFFKNVKEEREKEFFEKIIPKLEEAVEPSTPEERIQLVHSSVLEEEEQKPNDHLEKDIKEEIDDFLEEVKEEPLNEECFERFVPKLKKTIDPCLIGTSNRSTPTINWNSLPESATNSSTWQQNFSECAPAQIYPYDYRAPIVFPTINKNILHNPKPYQLRIKSDLLIGASIPALIPKGSMPSSSNQKTFQPVIIRDDGKLELIDDVIEDSHERKKSDKNVSRMNTEHINNNSAYKLCQICLEKKHRLDMKPVTLEEDRLVLVIGYLLRKDCTLDEAKHFMSRWTYMCHTHFSDAIDTISEALQIRNYKKLNISRHVLMQKLMITVNTLRPQIKSWEFRDILRRFVWKHSEKRMNARTQSPVRKPYEYRCSVCSQMLDCSLVKSVTLEKDKLVIIIGCVLRGVCNPDQAQLLVSESTRIFICPDHYYEAFNEIYKRLDIQNSEEIDSCSDELMRNLMVTVNSIYPRVETSQFCEILLGYVRRNFTKYNDKKKLNTIRCAKCKQITSLSHSMYVTVQKEKLIIVIGYILCGDFTLEEAKQFISEKNYVYICYIHLVEVSNAICKALHITMPEEVFSCSSKLMENVMLIVNSIDPGFTISSFQKYFHIFGMRNKKYRSITN